MGGFLGIGNSSAKTDRGNQLGGVNAAWNVYNRGLPMSDTTAEKGNTNTDSGILALEDAKGYWKNLLHGDKASIMRANAPAINSVIESADTRRKEQAEMGTSRGGGVAGVNQEAATQTQAQIDNIIAGAQPEAAKQIQTIGTTQTAAGHQELAQALSALGLSGDVAQEIIESSIKSRPISMTANQAVQQQWSNFMAALGL